MLWAPPRSGNHLCLWLEPQFDTSAWGFPHISVNMRGPWNVCDSQTFQDMLLGVGLVLLFFRKHTCKFRQQDVRYNSKMQANIQKSWLKVDPSVLRGFIHLVPCSRLRGGHHQPSSCHHQCPRHAIIMPYPSTLSEGCCC